MRAVLFSQTHPRARPSTDEFEGPDSMARARALRDSVAPDFPEGVFAVGGDAEAVREDAVQRTSDMLQISLDEARTYFP